MINTKELQVTDEQITALAENTLKCDPAALNAVIEVEGRGRGYDSRGHPKILFESKWFSRLTNGRYDLTHPMLSTRIWNPSLYTWGWREWRRLDKACDLDEDAGNQAASWGMMQVMGFNYSICGFDSIGSFVTEMHTHERAQLAAGVAFIKHSKLDGYLRNCDWHGFARRYNGPGYRKNKYAAKLAAAYRKHAGEDEMIPPVDVAITYDRRVKVRHGDTLTKIARNNNIEFAALLKLNPQISDPNRIHVGQYVCVA